MTDDAGDLNKDGFNESEGCYVLRGEGAVELACPTGAGLHQPAFKILGHLGAAAEQVTADGTKVPFVAGSANGEMAVQVLARVAGGAKVVIGK